MYQYHLSFLLSPLYPHCMDMEGVLFRFIEIHEEASEMHISNSITVNEIGVS
jgi:hypothetical protein